MAEESLLGKTFGGTLDLGSSFNPETGKGLYGTGDTGALITSGPNAGATVAPPQPAAESYQMDTVVVEGTKAAEQVYTEQQSTEQEVPKVLAVEQSIEAPDLEEISPSVKAEVINVVDDYDWTLSLNKKQLGEKVPRIILTEFNITASNVVQSLYSGLMAWSDLRAANAAGVRALGGVAAGVGSDIINAVGLQGATSSVVGGAKDLANFLDNKADGKLGSFMKSVGNAPAAIVDKAESYAKSKFNRQAPGFGAGGSNLVNLYGDIYARKETGKTYMLPYFTQEYLSVHNSFQDTYEHSLASSIKAAIDKVVEAYEQIPALVEPGVYVQRPKFYQFKSTNTATHQISFTLFNTVTPFAYMQNAALIQTLALSNMPRRKTRVVVDPPCIYELLIPGKAFHPYCYIRDMTVKHLGTKRVINGETIPDAYQIDITIESLLSEASNFYDAQMQHHNVQFSDASNAFNSGSMSLDSGELYVGNDVSTTGASEIQRDAIANNNIDIMSTASLMNDPNVAAMDSKYQSYLETGLNQIQNANIDYVNTVSRKTGVKMTPRLI